MESSKNKEAIVLYLRSIIAVLSFASLFSAFIFTSYIHFIDHTSISIYISKFLIALLIDFIIITVCCIAAFINGKPQKSFFSDYTYSPIKLFFEVVLGNLAYFVWGGFIIGLLISGAALHDGWFYALVIAPGVILLFIFLNFVSKYDDYESVEYKELLDEFEHLKTVAKLRNLTDREVIRFNELSNAINSKKRTINQFDEEKSKALLKLKSLESSLQTDQEDLYHLKALKIQCKLSDEDEERIKQLETKILKYKVEIATIHHKYK